MLATPALEELTLVNMFVQQVDTDEEDEVTSDVNTPETFADATSCRLRSLTFVNVRTEYGILPIVIVRFFQSARSFKELRIDLSVYSFTRIGALWPLSALPAKLVDDFAVLSESIPESLEILHIRLPFEELELLFAVKVLFRQVQRLRPDIRLVLEHIDQLVAEDE